VTGRFHHLVAAAALGTPTVMMPGNTAKVDAVCDLIGFSRAISPGAADFADGLAAAIRAPNRTTSAQREMLVERAKKNLAFS
jgi:polysaccharide pyruvyl transferase WcaK-like protein